MHIEVNTDGYETWRDTIALKPYKLNLDRSITLTENLPKIEVDSSSALIAYDRLSASFSDGKKIGTYKDEDGEVIEEIKWDGGVKLGSTGFEELFYEVLTNNGFNTPLKQAAELFSNSSEERKKYPRYLIGAKLLEYDVQLQHEKLNILKKEDVLGRTTMKLRWGILDKTTDKVALELTTTGIGRYRIRDGIFINNLSAFEDALYKLMSNPEFLELINNHPIPNYEMLNEADSSIASRTINNVVLPKFENNSEMINRVSKSCVTIATDVGHGSGAVISNEGHILTADHVVQNMNKIEVQFSNGLTFNAQILARDRRNDVALIKIEGSGFPALPIQQKPQSNLGQEVFTIGTPSDIELGQSVSRGIISGRRKAKGRLYTQLDMAVSLGNSGGPLINSNGEIIGIIQTKIIKEGVEGIGFAVPIDRALNVLNLSIEDTK